MSTSGIDNATGDINHVHVTAGQQSALKDDCRGLCAPKNHSPYCHNLYNWRKPLDNKCWIRLVAWLPPYTYGLIISIEFESRFISEDHTSPIGPIPAYVGS
ncbi:hypothetical protein TNCV_1299101 [Trichonephila clavipes]|nr:hypothetical protein TNCV_1299101 [Trichonephila clavipes]